MCYGLNIVLFSEPTHWSTEPHREGRRNKQKKKFIINIKFNIYKKMDAMKFKRVELAILQPL